MQESMRKFFHKRIFFQISFNPWLNKRVFQKVINRRSPFRFSDKNLSYQRSKILGEAAWNSIEPTAYDSLGKLV